MKLPSQKTKRHNRTDETQNHKTKEPNHKHTQHRQRQKKGGKTTPLKAVKISF